MRPKMSTESHALEADKPVMKPMRLRLEAGPLERKLNGSELTAFEAILEHATDFALLNRCAEMAGFLAEAGQKKKRRLKGLFEGVEILTEPAVRYLRVHEYPTIGGRYPHNDPRFLAYGPLTRSARGFLRRSTDRIFATYGARWDDLCLLQGNRLVFFNCTHEGFGSVFGEEQFLEQLPISTDSARAKPCDYRIVGEILDRQLVLELA